MRIAVVLLAAVTGTALFTGTAAAATPTDLFVSSAATCSDAGPGSQAEPFCTVQRAADVVNPGQTVHVIGVFLEGDVTLTRSGTADQPIKFVGQNTFGTDVDGDTTGFRLTGVHNVIISDMELSGAGVSIVDSSAVTIDSARIAGRGAGIELSGQTSDVTISRDILWSSPDGGVVIDPGVTGTTVTTDFFGKGGVAVVATDAPGTVITSNTVQTGCQSDIVVSGNTTNAIVENDVLDAVITGPTGVCPALVSVAADAADGTTADYNVLWDGGRTGLYNWGGTSYSTPADFMAATGQGGHDIAGDPDLMQLFGGLIGQIAVAEGSPAIDSGDANAPGELPTDLKGKPRLDDLLTQNTGTGTGIVDRGAFEVQDPYQVSDLTTSLSRSPVSVPVTFTASVFNPWSTPTQYTFDFGDGTPPVVTASPSVTHVFAGPPGGYRVSLVAVTSDGVRMTANQLYNVVASVPLSATAHAFQTGVLGVRAEVSTSDSFAIRGGGYSFDFGDGSAPVTDSSAATGHTYAQPGTYTVSATVTDEAGNTVTASAQVTVASAYQPLSPVRVLDTRNGTGAAKAKLGPNGTLKLHLAGTHGLPATGVTAVVLNVTATSPSIGGVLTVYPDGKPKPATSSLNFSAGQTIPNLVTVPLGADGSVAITNLAGTVDVVADLEGAYVDTGVPFDGVMLHTTTSTRVLDTRTSGGAIGPKGVRTLTLPVTATAAILNVTVTNPSVGGVLTVYPAGQAEPTASNLNFTKGETTSNLVIVPVTGNSIDIANLAGTVHVVVDLEGYYDQSDEPALGFTPAGPTRLLDTRTTGGPVAANTTRGLKVAGVDGVPVDVKAVALNVTVTGPTVGGFLTVYPDDVARPVASNLNFGKGETIPNQVIVPVGADGKVDFYNLAGSTNVVVDLAGYFQD